MSPKTFFMTDELYDYFLAIGVRDQEILKELRQETSSLPTAEMQISPEQGQFMSMLVKLIQAKDDKAFRNVGLWIKLIMINGLILITYLTINTYG